jgi:putative membrane protein
MVVAIVATVNLTKYMLEQYPIIFFAFVFGLIVASVVLVYKKVSKWTLTCYLLCLFGVGLAWLLPAETAQAAKSAGGIFENVPLWYFFVCAMVASWAFILPGTSGTFVMVLMGGYHTLVNVFHAFDIAYIAVYAFGCIFGLIVFSNFLSWLLKRYYDFTVALLTGFIIGSLKVIWPWKEKVCNVIFVFDAYGVPWPEEVCRIVGNARPEGMVTEAAIACALGLVIVLGIEFIARKIPKKAS